MAVAQMMNSSVTYFTSVQSQHSRNNFTAEIRNVKQARQLPHKEAQHS